MLPLGLLAQTNQQANISTNAPVKFVATNLDDILWNQFQSITNALPAYYQIGQDEVDDTKTITLRDYEELESTRTTVVY